MCLKTHVAPQAQRLPRRRAESLELRRTSTWSRVSKPDPCTRMRPLHEGVLGLRIRSKRWAVPRVGRSEGDDSLACAPHSLSRVAPHIWPRGGPDERGNLGRPWGDQGDLE